MRRHHRRPPVRPARSIATGASLIVAAVGVSGCFTTAADFRNDAETFIEDNDDLRDALLGDSENTFTEATCDEPVNQDVGTTFACTATDSLGDVWEFEIAITGSSEYEVNLSRAPDGS
jgi:hypothetical protein